jgi:hypothetical protein
MEERGLALGERNSKKVRNDRELVTRSFQDW